MSAAPGGSRLAEKRRLLEGLRVPRPVVSTWGLANLEISVPIGSFPVPGAEETFVDGRIDAVVGGVAANVSRGLSRLGVRVHAHLVVGADGLGAQVRDQLDGWEGVTATVVPTPECPRTVVLYADDGQRHILMDPRAATSTDFPAAMLDTIGEFQLAHVTLADIGRPVLAAAAAAGVPVAVDLQAVGDIDSERVRAYAAAASVLFLSGAALVPGRTPGHLARGRRHVRHPHRRHGDGVGRRGHDRRRRRVGHHLPRLLPPAGPVDTRGR